MTRHKIYLIFLDNWMKGLSFSERGEHPALFRFQCSLGQHPKLLITPKCGIIQATISNVGDFNHVHEPHPEGGAVYHLLLKAGIQLFYISITCRPQIRDTTYAIMKLKKHCDQCYAPFTDEKKRPHVSESLDED